LSGLSPSTAYEAEIWDANEALLGKLAFTTPSATDGDGLTNLVSNISLFSDANGKVNLRRLKKLAGASLDQAAIFKLMDSGSKVKTEFISGGREIPVSAVTLAKDGDTVQKGRDEEGVVLDVDEGAAANVTITDEDGKSFALAVAADGGITLEGVSMTVGESAVINDKKCTVYDV